MINNISTVIKKIKNELFYMRPYKSYSQEGEDMVAKRLLGDVKKDGFYVDIGAHHPFRFSNTCHFSKLGWHGINVDPLPGAMDKFKIFRRRDLNLELGISNVTGPLVYHMFSEPALNTFDEKLALQRRASNIAKVIEERSVEVITLEALFDRYLERGQLIDFLTVDVEGLDYEVLSSNNWSKYRPRLIICEILSMNSDSIEDSPVHQLLQSASYKHVANVVNSHFYLAH